MMRTGRWALLLAAVAVMTAASPASAHNFHSEANATVLLGEQIGEHEFESPGQAAKVHCPKARLQGTMAAPTTSQLRFDPVYEECHFAFQVLSQVTMNGCQYLLHGETDADGHGRFEIACPPNKAIQIDMGTICTVTIVAQTVQGVSYANEGTGTKRDLRITLTAGGISYQKTGFFCASVFGNGKDLQFTGTFTVRGYKDIEGFPAEQVGLRVE
jgi:hypothetical protein